MKKFRLLLLDANIVIQLFREEIWSSFLQHCDVHLSRIVAETEALYYCAEGGLRHKIDLTEDIRSGRITIFDISVTDLKKWKGQFDPIYLEKLDDGEAESLAYLFQQSEICRICSADKIVYRVLGNLDLSESGISLQEILDQIGSSRSLPREFSKSYRVEWTRKGVEERLRGIGRDGL